MTQEAWNLTPENGKGMTRLVMTIGLVTEGWASTAGKHQASVPSPFLDPHLALPLLLPAVEGENGETNTCWASYRPGAPLIILPALQVRYYHPNAAYKET